MTSEPNHACHERNLLCSDSVVLQLFLFLPVPVIVPVFVFFSVPVIAGAVVSVHVSVLVKEHETDLIRTGNSYY